MFYHGSNSKNSIGAREAEGVRCMPIASSRSGSSSSCVQDEYVFAVRGNTIVRHKKQCLIPMRARSIKQIIARKFDFGNKIELMLLKYLMKKFVGRTVLSSIKDGIFQQLGGKVRVSPPFSFGKYFRR